MKVKPNQNSSISAQSESNFADGTSNTIMSSESSKAENPFAKDTFESGLMTQDHKGVEQTPTEKSFMDYTDDSCD